MAAKGGSYIKWQKTSRRCFMTALSSAVLEWLLILMLLMNGVFAYVITWFARYCELQIPCLLCSRLDHVLGSEAMRSYWDLMCKSHKSEISSLVLCTLHEKLVDVHEMCENCLFSFATKDKSNSETYRLLVGKLGLNAGNDFDDSPLLGDQKSHSRSSKLCCCCNEPWSSRSHAQALLHTKSIELEKGDVDVPLTREFRLNWSSSIKENKRPSFLTTISTVHESFEDCSPHFGYSELKLNSDTESEDRECDVEESTGNAFIKNIEDTAEEKHRISNVSSLSSNLIDHEQSQSDMIKSNDTIPEKHIVQESSLLETPNLIDDWMKPRDTVLDKPIVPDAAVLEPPNLIDHELSHSDLIESHKVPSTLPTVVGHGLEELNWQDIDLKAESTPASSEPIGVVNVPESPNAADIQVDPSKGYAGSYQEDIEAPLEAEQDIHLKAESSPESSDPIGLDNVPESPNAADDEVDPSKDYAGSYQKDIEVPLEAEQTARPENIERKHEAEKEHATTDVADPKINNDGGVVPAANLELGDAYKLAVSSRGRQLSGKTIEQLLGKDSTRVSEDLKLLLSQLSAARGLDSPLTSIMSPRLSGNLEDSRALDSLASIGLQLFQKRFSLERNDSGFESLDVSAVSEVDGETEVEQLKRQIDHDKKFMSALYKELEEERSAAAVAANQALAMITRLQEEKAALQMEALHDLRMMEDQAEYDVEALERANELLAEKEREIQDLEAELDYYRIKYHDNELMSEDEEPEPKSSLLGFEDERLYISHRLSNLEKKLHLFSNTGIYSDLQNGDCINMDEEKHAAGSALESEKDDNKDVIVKANNFTSLSNRRSLVRRVNSPRTPKYVGQESLVHNEQADMVSLGYEVSNLNERLQALEADRKFLEHAMNSLRNGEDGVRFLQEIASHLRELRRVGVKRKQSLA